MKKVKFYHAGCPVCVEAEENILNTIDRSTHEVESINVGGNQTLISQIESIGLKSVPAMVVDETVFHINFGASIADLKG